MKLLHIDSSALGDNSASRPLTAEVVAGFRDRESNVEVIYRDLDKHAPAHLTGMVLAAQAADAATLSPEVLADVRYGNALIAEFLAADVIVIGAPMYNFSIPTPLKAWIDRIVKAGITFKYDANGAVGLATGKRAVIVSSRGGKLPNDSPLDHQESYLRGMLGFIGVTDVTIVRADGLAYGPEAAAASIAGARESITRDLAAVA
ncbi:FMN-dependent NADH-azoreductase AzoR2 [soil metagenome]